MRFECGVDITKINRFVNMADKGPSYIKHFFSEEEISDATHNDKILPEKLAGKFAAKEAFVKSIGTGFNSFFSPGTIHVSKDSLGRPIIVLNETAEAEFLRIGGISTSLSISHDGEYAIAVSYTVFN